jgi:putative ABC transport system ATP-binding protein
MITFENIVKTYHMGETTVQSLRGVSCHVDTGEMVAIIGPSGCGKSTMMHIMGCLDAPTSGKYFLDGAEVSKLSDSQLAEVRNKKIGFIFQSFNLLARTSAVANVELPLIYGNSNNRRKKALDALERVGLAKRAFHMPNQLSGGEQQRVAIARALVNKPPIILADEPTGNLDSKSSNEIMLILEKLNKEDGITIVMVTHEAEIAQRANRTIALRDGQIVSDLTIPGKGKANL